jgi:predicted KAP-like P-loop ATPase
MEILFFALLFAVFSAVVASSKGRSGFGWFLIGLFFGPFGLIVALLPSKATPAAAAPESPAPIDRNFSVSRARPITVRNEIHTTQRGTQMPKAQLEKFSWELDEDDDLSTAAVSVIDEPVPQGKTDKLGISLHSEALTEFVEKTETPITVGIQGEWGSGKTSLINSIFHHFKNHPNVKQIEVNAWEYSLLSAPEEALVKIVGKIITDLVEEDPKNELVKNLKKRAAIIFRGALRVSAHAVLGSDAAEATDALLDPESPDIRQLREDLEKVIDEMAKSGSNPYDRIIIYVDDLDRIEPKNAVAILELLKNFFSVKRCVFILAIDYDVVVKGLEDKFGKPTLENEWEFRAFFDKIIQLPFQMPMDDYSIAKYVNSLLFEVGFVEDKGLDEEKITEITRWTIGGNPRSIKRLVNSVSLNQIFAKKKNQISAKKRKEKPWSSDSSSNRLVEGIDIKEEKLLLFSLYCLQIAYPPIYSLLLD